MTTATQSLQSANVEPVAPPTPQEITRKLSVHNKPSKPKFINPIPNPNAVSGTESDTESSFSPEQSSLQGAQASPPGGSHPQPIGFPPNQTHAQSHSHSMSLGLSTSASSKPLSSIAERRSGSHDDETDDDEDGEGEEPWVQEQEADAAVHRQKAEGESVLKSGYLLKKGERRKTWKKRWFVLRSTQLAVYKNSAEYRLLRLLDLSDVHSCTPVDLKRHANSFCLVVPDRTYYLQASNDSDLQTWVTQVNMARELLLGTSTQNSASTPPMSIPQSANHQPSALSRSSGAGANSSPPSARSATFTGPVTSDSESEDQAIDGPRPSTSATSPSKGQASAVAPMDPSKVVLSGYLMKCRSKRRGWRKRWFMLTSSSLIYSANHMDTKRRRVIDLSQVIDALDYDLSQDKNHTGTAIVSPPALSAGEEAQLNDGESFSGAGAQHTFKVVTTKRALLLCAPSEAEEIKWLSTVRALLARRSNPPTSNPASNTISPAAVPEPSGGGILGTGMKAAVSIPGRKRSASGASTLLLDATAHH